MQTLRFANEFCSLMLTKLAYRTRFPLQRQEISAKENYFSYLLALITAWARRSVAANRTRLHLQRQELLQMQVFLAII